VADQTLKRLQLAALKTKFTVVALDLNGHGHSPVRPGEGLAPYLQDVLAVANALDKPFVVVGHSMGGALALQVGLKNPKGLVGIGVTNAGARLRVLPALLALLEADFEGAVDFLLGLMFHRSLPLALQKSRAQMLQAGQAVVLKDFQACDRFDVIGRLEEVQVPAWVCVGRQDQLTPLDYATYLTQHLRRATLHVIDDAGHMPMVEQAPAFNETLLDFLDHLVP